MGMRDDRRKAWDHEVERIRRKVNAAHKELHALVDEYQHGTFSAIEALKVLTLCVALCENFHEIDDLLGALQLGGGVPTNENLPGNPGVN